MTKIINPTLGSDFELFVKEIDTNKIVPCPIEHGGTKEQPLGIGEGCFRQIDGVASEANIPPATTVDQWCNSIQYCKDTINTILFPLGLELVAKSVHHFNEEQFTQPRHTTFGCTPSWDAYTMNENHPNADEAGTMRTTGAHIHIGFHIGEEDDIDMICQRLIYSMDRCVGIPFLNIDTNTERRKLYGKAGEFRKKIVFKDNKPLLIVEYRSLGGECINHPKLMFDLTQQAIELYNSDHIFDPEQLEEQRQLINHKQEEYAL